mgnify:FL=1
MPFLSLSFVDYRNIENASIDLLSKEVFFKGDNGQGKTNLLEALYICSYGSSFRTKNDVEIIKKPHSAYSIKALYKDSHEITHSIVIKFENGKKHILKNGKKITDRKELINAIPCIVFCHEDLDFVTGEPEKRRFFLDQSISLHNNIYVDSLRKYKKILRSRNIVLKEQNFDLLPVFTENLIQTGMEIRKKREDISLFFNRDLSSLYEEISGISGLSLSYHSSWKKMNKDEIEVHLKAKEGIEKNLGTSVSGPHRDRIIFIKDGENFVLTASTGQKRLLSVLLRILQAKYIFEVNHKKPILLMDDVLLELDPGKREKIMHLLPEYEQLFATFLPGEPYEKYVKSKTKVYTIQKGHWDER